jgi:hypothetical protein
MILGLGRLAVRNGAKRTIAGRPDWFEYARADERGRFFLRRAEVLKIAAAGGPVARGLRERSGL